MLVSKMLMVIDGKAKSRFTRRFARFMTTDGLETRHRRARFEKRAVFTMHVGPKFRVATLSVLFITWDSGLLCGLNNSQHREY